MQSGPQNDLPRRFYLFNPATGFPAPGWYNEDHLIALVDAVSESG
ncbi:MAG: hypothetical protein ACFE0O_12315 [Opitutales bacterium]